MKISFGTRISKLEAINDGNGYGYATQCMLASLQRLGYHVAPNDASADVEIWFDQPPNWNFSDGPYRIGYHPWESTQLKKGWAEIMNQCDEIWTPSPLIADWYRRYAGVRVPVYVYLHGIDHVWNPVRRVRNGPIKFLNVGAEAARKKGWDTVRAFRAAFGRRDDVTHTLKFIHHNWMNLSDLGGVRYLNGKWEFPQIRQLFYEHDIYVYPSCGEGFGLTPLQAISSGMPTITVHEWAPYSEYLDSELRIPAKLVTTPWPKIHPGKVFRPSFDDMVDLMRYAVDNFDEVSNRAFDTAPAVHEAYDWDIITDQVFTDLEKRLIEKNIL